MKKKVNVRVYIATCVFVLLFLSNTIEKLEKMLEEFCNTSKGHSAHYLKFIVFIFIFSFSSTIWTIRLIISFFLISKHSE